MATRRAGAPTLGAVITSGLAVRAVSALAPIVLVPLVLRSVGGAVYGVWVAGVSLSAFLLVCDLGVSSALLTILPQSRSEEGGGVGIVRAAYLAVAIAAGFGLVATAVLAGVGGLHHLAGLPASVEGVSTDAVVAMVLVSFLITLPVQLVVRVLLADHRVMLANTVQALAALSPLPAVAIAQHLGAGPLMLFACVTFPGPIVYAVVTLWVALRSHAVRGAHRSRGGLGRNMRRLVGMGFIFLLITTVSGAVAAMDNLIIGRYLGPQAVASYGVVQRLFSQLTQVTTIVTLPMWPAAAAALQRGDTAWVSRTTRRMGLLGSSVVLGAGLLAATILLPLLQRWLGGGVRLDAGLMAGFAMLCASQALLAPLLMTANGAGRLWGQLVAWVALGAISVPVKILVVRNGHVSYLPLVSSLLYLAVVGLAAALIYRRVMSSTRETS